MTDMTEDRDALAEQLLALNVRIGDIRGIVFTLTRRVSDARKELGEALQAYLSGRPRVSVQDNIRAHLAASLAERAAIASGEMDAPPPATPADSVIDRQAAWSHGGSASDHVRQNMRNGGYRRGSFPSHAKGSRVSR